MARRHFQEMIKSQWTRGNFVCVGLDSEYDKIPKSARVGSVENTIVAFNRAIVKATKDVVCAYKPNVAFYEAHGDIGIAALRRTITDINAIAPDVPVILDAKRADIGNTNAGYVKAAFEYLQADAITVHPYLGAEALEPFLVRAEKGIIVLCRTSNPGSGEFQDLHVRIGEEEMAYRLEAANEDDLETRNYCMRNLHVPLYQHVAYQVSKHWNKHGNCALVVGATHPYDLVAVRNIAPDMPILIPGIGAQGGEVEKTISAGKDSHGQGMVVNSSRGIIFASKGEDFAEAARRETLKLHDLINQYRMKGAQS